MNKLISAAILLLIAFVIIIYLLPLLSGSVHTLALIVVVVGAIVGLMRIAGMTF